MADGYSMAAAAWALWRRAPMWRLVSMFAGLATLLFVLFPPRWPQREVSATATPAATYIPQPPPQPPPVPPRVVNSSSPPVVTPAPRAAALSLAVPGRDAPVDNGTGLSDAMTGKLYDGSIRAAGFAVPLPEGQWVILAKGALNPKSGKGTYVGAMYYLGRIEQKQLAATALIYALSDKTSQAITASEPLKIQPGCRATNRTYMFKPESYDDNFPTCWELHTHFAADMRRWADRAAPMGSLERAAAGDLAAKGVAIPQEMISVAYIFTQKWGLLYADYEFSPEFQGIKSTEVPGFADSDWNPTNISRFPEKLVFQEKIRRWGAAFWPKIQTAFMTGMP